MKPLIYFLFGAVAGIAAGTALCGRPSVPSELISRTDTLKIVDTVTVSRPTASLTVSLPAIKVRAERATDGPGADSVARDSVDVMLRPERHVYEGADWRAVVSGVAPSLDSLTFAKERTVVTVRERRRRWGLSATAGVALSRHGVEPAVAVGLSYTFMSF